MSIHKFVVPVDLFRPANITAVTSAVFVVVTKSKVAPVNAMKSCR